jgi:hypothetical protein
VQFPWSGIWKLKVPPRVAFFIWTTTLGKIQEEEYIRSILEEDEAIKTKIKTQHKHHQAKSNHN